MIPPGAILTSSHVVISEPVYSVIYIDDCVDVRFVRDGVRERTEIRLSPAGTQLLHEALWREGVAWRDAQALYRAGYNAGRVSQASR